MGHEIWEAGVAGSANIVHFDGDDIRPRAFATEPHRSRIIADHNALSGRDPAKLAAVEEAIEWFVNGGPLYDGSPPSPGMVRSIVFVVEGARERLRAALAAFRMEAAGPGEAT